MVLDNNLRVADLTGLAGDVPREISKLVSPILTKTEPWEYSLTKGPDKDPLRYPTVVRNTCGPRPDDKYYLYYAHHDIPSGIGCAVADELCGPYVKLAGLDAGRDHSQVLELPRDDVTADNAVLLKHVFGSTPLDHEMIGNFHHLSSPCVLWNPKAELWFLYFHTYQYLWPSGGGHQQTYLATCRDLATHDWEILKNPDGTWQIVLPVTAEPWMNSQSSYHSICGLPDGRFVAYLNGTGGEYIDGQWQRTSRGLGFAMSDDGISWDYSPDNPFVEDEGKGLATGMIGYLGNDEYLVVWADSERVHYGRTTDFRTITRDPGPAAEWQGGLINPWRDGDTLYLFTGNFIAAMKLPVG